LDIFLLGEQKKVSRGAGRSARGPECALKILERRSNRMLRIRRFPQIKLRGAGRSARGLKDFRF
jgi:hypothetical protein